MNIDNDFIRSLLNITPQQNVSNPPNITIFNGRVYDKDSFKFKVYKSIANFFNARSEKTHRHVEFLGRLLAARQVTTVETLNNRTSTQRLIGKTINEVFTKILRSQELSVITEADLRAFITAAHTIQDPHELVELLAKLRNSVQSFNPTTPEGGATRDQINLLINHCVTQLLVPEQFDQLNLEEQLFLNLIDPTQFHDPHEQARILYQSCLLLQNETIPPAQKLQIQRLITPLINQLFTTSNINALNVNELSQVINSINDLANPNVENMLAILNKLGNLNLTEITNSQLRSFLTNRFTIIVSSLQTQIPQGEDQTRKYSELAQTLNHAHIGYFENNPRLEQTIRFILDQSETKAEIFGGGITPQPAYQEFFWQAISKLDATRSSTVGPIINGTLYISEGVLSPSRQSTDEKWNRGFWTSLRFNLSQRRHDFGADTPPSATHVVFQGTDTLYPKNLLFQIAEMSLAANPVPDPRNLLNFAFVNITPGSEPLLTSEGDPILPQFLLDLKPQDVTEEIFHAALAYQVNATKPQPEDREGVQNFLISSLKEPTGYFDGKDLIRKPPTYDLPEDYWRESSYSVNNRGRGVILSSIPEPGQAPTYREISPSHWNDHLDSLKSGEIVYRDIFTPIDLALNDSDVKTTFSLAELKLLMPKYANNTLEEWGKLQLTEEEMRSLVAARQLMFDHIAPAVPEIIPLFAFMQKQGVRIGYWLRFISGDDIANAMSRPTLSSEVWSFLLEASSNEMTFEDILTPVEITLGPDNETRILSRAEIKLLMPQSTFNSDQLNEFFRTLDTEGKKTFEAYYQIRVNHVQPPDELIRNILTFMHKQGITRLFFQESLEKRLINILAAELDEGKTIDQETYELLNEIAKTQDLKRYLATHLPSK